MILRTLCALAALSGPALGQVPAPAPVAPAPVVPAPVVPAPVTPAPVARDAEIQAIQDALRLPELLAILSREGEEHGRTLGASLFGEGRAPAAWADRVAALHDPARLDGPIRAALSEGLALADTAAILAFLRSPPGEAMVGLELAAREALLDDDAEQAAREAAAVALAEEDPRLDLLRRYAEAADLIDSNVAAAMNASLAYLGGLRAGGGLGADATEADAIADVWEQEPRLRAETTEWLYAFLLRAYAPASDSEIESLVAFLESPPGRTLNQAVFRAFDAAMADLSRDLGLAAARVLTTEEI
ncbi:DUF2059 domain-containing protein [Rubellimicrobium aerolatum]|uniref:DUF2059 domain-containing protein n=1 Tax=Rubellimicrobium aerolatum TaxID=490979 RepID=A0ABW0S838_9RHOB|nr:DUF2059 domain-containing protein [Rubellimicrobium aerolatum]MBP1804367.1 hypothetical protein [Rubellimicrobium aerolatum]